MKMKEVEQEITVSSMRVIKIRFFLPNSEILASLPIFFLSVADRFCPVHTNENGDF